MSASDLFVADLAIMFVAHVAFMYTTYRRLFVPPDGSSLIATALSLVFLKLMVPSLFVWGWIRHRRFHLTRLMLFWTALLAVSVLMFSLDNEGTPTWTRSCLYLVAFLFISGFGLIPHFRQDEAIRALARDPSETSITRVVRFGPAAIPDLERIFSSDDYLVRLAVLECFARLGPRGREAIERAQQDYNTQVAAAASELLKDST